MSDQTMHQRAGVRRARAWLLRDGRRAELMRACATADFDETIEPRRYRPAAAAILEEFNAYDDFACDVNAGGESQFVVSRDAHRVAALTHCSVCSHERFTRPHQLVRT